MLRPISEISSRSRCEEFSREPFLPELFWMYLVGIMLFWVFDESAAQIKTNALIHQLTHQIVRLVRFTRIPLTGTVLSPLLRTLELVMPLTKDAAIDAAKDADR